MTSAIRDLAILDLREIPAEELRLLDLVEDVRTVILSAANAEAFMRVSRRNVRSHIIIDSDELLNIGHINFDDGFLSSLPDDSQVVLVGCPFVDSFSMQLFVKKVRSIRIFGQVLYSDAKTVSSLVSRLEQLQGQLLAISPPTLRWVGPTLLNRDLLKSVDRRNVVSVGPITIDPQVTVKDIFDNMGRMTQVGAINGREEAICALLSLCRVRVGTYNVIAPPPPMVDVAESHKPHGNPLVTISGLAHP